MGRRGGRPLVASLEEFLGGAFGPLLPMTSMPIDDARDDSERAQPRRSQYPVGWNLPHGVPGSEGMKLSSFANLRAYADVYSVVRAVIQVRKDEILGLEWDIIPTEDAARTMKEDTEAFESFSARRKEAVEFFRRPDPSYHNYEGWMQALLEDLFVCDAMSLYLHPSRVPGRGLLGSDLAGLDCIDGTTVRPLLDLRGGIPRPPNPAYQQYLWGVPRVDMTDVIFGTDLEQMGEAVEEYRGDQLLYLPYMRRSFTPYGFPGIERCLVPVVTGLRQQQFALSWFTEGTIPGMFVVPGPGVDTPEQIRKLQDTLNFIAGDAAWKHKIIVLPHGSDTKEHKKVELSSQFDEQIMLNVCMAYEVDPGEIGIPLGSNKGGIVLGSSGDGQKQKQDNRDRRSLTPLLRWLKRSIMDFVLQDICQQADMQWKWLGLDSEEDAMSKVKRLDSEIRIGMRSIDEARHELGKDPWGKRMTSEPILVTSTGALPLGEIEPEDIVADLLTQGGAPNGGGGTPLQGGEGSAADARQPNGRPTQKLLTELDVLRRYLKRGKSVDEFEALELDDAVLDIVRKVAGGGDWQAAIQAGRTLVKARARSSVRDGTVRKIRERVGDGLEDLAVALTNEEISTIGFVDEGAKKIHAGYIAALAAGAMAAASEHRVAAARDFTKEADARVSKQHEFLQGLAKDVHSRRPTWSSKPVAKSDVREAFSARMDLYGSTVQAAWEQGYGKSLTSSGGEDEWSIIWVALVGDCELCRERDGQIFTPDTLPGYPGDGAFGDICKGGPACQCALEWVKGKVTTVSAPAQALRFSKAAMDNGSGGMVALYPSRQVAEALAVEDGLPVEELHVTLVFLTEDAAATGPTIQSLIRETVARIAAQSEPLRGKIAGAGMFNGDGDLRPVYASPDVPGLSTLREAIFAAIVDASAGTDYEPASDHGFTPHMTLTYVPADEPVVLPKLDDLDLEFTEVWLVWGGERESFALAGD